MIRIGEQEILRGITFTRLLDEGIGLLIKRRQDLHESFFTVDHDGLVSAFLVKTSTAPKNIWQFKFSEAEVEAVQAALGEVSPDQCFALLVCRTDGICCLPAQDLLDLLEDSTTSRAISVTRPPGGSYRVSGPGRTPLGRTIPANDWPRRALQGGAG